MRPHRRIYLAIAAAVALSAATAPVARLQDTPRPTFRTEANYVRVDAYPTLKGAPVTDLRREDFELLEDNVLQPIDAFEFVSIRGGITPEARKAEPATVAESQALLENTRARVFVIFLDINHVEADASSRIRQPLVNALNRTIGPDDLVGIMTPEMAASDVTFARRTVSIEGFLEKHWDWGQRGRIGVVDPREREYQQCFPGVTTSCGDDRGIADEMIARRREKMTLDALEELVDYLRIVREERKALLVISDGWRLYRPNPSLRRVLYCQPPAGQSVGVDPRTGRITTAMQDANGAAMPSCEADRMRLADLDDASQFESILDRANRANVTFYPVDPRGLVVFDTPIDYQRTGLPARGQPILPPASVDNAALRDRQRTLSDLASATDGVAIMNTNDLDRGLSRVIGDLSSYYLLGYYSSGRMDGKFHSIRVRVKRAGVDVRARRGYQALTQAELAQTQVSTAMPSGGAGATAMAASITGAIGALTSAAREVPLRTIIVAGRRANERPGVWAVGEVGRGSEWRSGATVVVMLNGADGQTVATARDRIAAGARSFRLAIPTPATLAPGDYTVLLRAAPADGGAATTESARVTLRASGASGVLFSRRGPSTGNLDIPTADPRFRRNEQLIAELPDALGTSTAARLLDRSGQPLPVPITVERRTDADGESWSSARVALAPLAAGDYLIEWRADSGAADSTPAGTVPTLAAFRVVP